MRLSARFFSTRRLLSAKSESGNDGKVLLKNLSLSQLLKEPLKHGSVVPEYTSQEDVPENLREYSPKLNAEALEYLESAGKGRAKKSATKIKEECEK